MYHFNILMRHCFENVISDLPHYIKLLKENVRRKSEMSGKNCINDPSQRGNKIIKFPKDPPEIALQ